MIQILRTNSSHQDFIDLVKKLDADLADRDGEEHAFYAQFNKIDHIKYALVAYQDQVPIGCGAIKAFDEKTMEVKRMYVPPAARGKGIATRLLKELETWTKELTFDRCVLETGKRQPEAIRLYEKNGYQTIPNYGQYQNVENSLCFGKELR